MYPLYYTDFLQLHMDPHEPLYNFEDHIAESANAFVPDEKGFSEDHCPSLPITFSMSDGFGSSYASSSSRSPSIQAGDLVKAESPDGDFITAPSCPPPEPVVMKKNTNITFCENARVSQRENPLPITTKPDVPSLISRSKMVGRTLPPASEPPRSLIPSGHKRRCVTSRSPVQLSDEDADDESDNDSDDDEYIPSHRPMIKRRRITYTPSRRSAPISNASLSPAPAKRVHGTSLSRNKQTSSVSAINKACDGPNLNFICPECGWKQANKRLPDFKRHLRTHTRPEDGDQSKGWWCKGILLEEAHKFDLPNDAKPYVFLGLNRIGGCMQTFSRRDALKRHLDNANVTCVGRPTEAWDA